MADLIQQGLQACARESGILSQILSQFYLRDYYKFCHMKPTYPQRHSGSPSTSTLNSTSSSPQPRRAASLPSAAASTLAQQAQNARARRTSLPPQTSTQAAAIPQPNPLPIPPLPPSLHPIAPPRHNGHFTGPLSAPISQNTPPNSPHLPRPPLLQRPHWPLQRGTGARA